MNDEPTQKASDHSEPGTEALEEMPEISDERDWEQWGAQIAADVRAGKLDKLVREADEDFRAGRTRVNCEALRIGEILAAVSRSA